MSQTYRRVGLLCINIGVIRITVSHCTAVNDAAPSSSSLSSSSSSVAERMRVLGYYTQNGFLTSEQIKSILAGLSTPTAEGKVRGKEVSKGRLHYNMLGSAFVESEEIKDLIADQILPIAVSELGLHAGQLMVTEVQIVDSLPLSDIQIWHADNAHRGITVVIPLVDLTDQNGPTELIVGSHSFLTSLWWDIAITKPILRAGDGLIFDARLLHRGGANLSDASRPILVVRIDGRRTQPPGMSTIGATGRYCLARSIALILGFK